jgi:hypothetical protein
MEENKKVDMVKGMFSNCTFNNSVVAGIAESGSQVFYEKSKEEDIEEDDDDTCAHEAIIEYVKRLKPLVKQELQGSYEGLWLNILDLKEVRMQVYNKGKQQDTAFNRNLVAQITHQLGDRVYVASANPSTMVEYLEPGKGREHAVRHKLGEMPEKPIKNAIEELFNKDF